MQVISVAKRGAFASSTPSPSAVSADEIRFRVSSEVEDHYGDIVVQAGLEFPSVLPAVADHDHKLDSAIGSWHQVERKGTETFATLRLLPAGTSRMADLVRALHADNHPIASSIYFNVSRNDVEPITKSIGGKSVQTGKKYKRGSVTEITLTQFPANPQAVAVARSLGFSDDEVSALSRPGTQVAADTSASVAAASAPIKSNLGPKMQVNLQDMIAAARAQLDAASAAHETALASVSDATETLDAVARSTDDLAAARKRVDTLVAAEQAQVARAVAQPAPAAVAQVVSPIARAYAAPAVVKPAALRNEAAGTLFAKLVVAKHLAASRHAGLHEVAEQLFPGQSDIIAVARTAVGVADTTTAGWAKEITLQDTRALMQEELRPISVFAALSAMGQSRQFNGAQHIIIPSSNVGLGNGGAAWVGQGGHIPVVQGQFSEARIEKLKVAGIIPATEELIRASIDPGAMSLFRTMLLQFLANLIDGSLLDNSAAVPMVRPVGLLNGATTAVGTAGGGVAAVQGDLKGMLASFVTANVGSRPVLLVNTNTKLSLAMMTTSLGEMLFRDEISQSRLLGFEVVASQHVPAGTAILVDAGYFSSAYDGPEIDESAHATISMADARAVAPTQAIDAAGAIGTANQVIPDGGLAVHGAPTGAGTANYLALSMFQTWSRAVRVVIPLGFAMTKTGAVVTRTAISW